MVARKSRIQRLTAQLKAAQAELVLEQTVLDTVAKATTAELYAMLGQALASAKRRVVALERQVGQGNIDGLKGLGTELANSIFAYNKPFKAIKARNAAKK